MRVVVAVAAAGCVGLGMAVLVCSRDSSFKLAPGWNIERVAEAPAILFPTAIVAAPDGTLFLGQDPMDMPGPATSPIDSVVAIKNGKVTVFADGLWAVMGLEWVNDTLYVVHAPYLSAFRDTDGDGRADQRTDLVTGLGPRIPAFNGINDHIASGIRLGIDGYLYISVGDKGIPEGKGRDGTTIRLCGGGVIRVRPDGTDLEVVSTGERNPLSVALTATDEIFTYGNDDDSKKWPNSLTHHIVGGHYGYPYEFLTAPDRALPIVDGQMGGAGAQGICYNEDGLCKKFGGNLFFCDWGRGAVIRYELTATGATYKVKAKESIVRRGTLGDFRPFSLAVGDNGTSLYLVDWACNGFLLSGTKTGRLFRLTYSGSDRVEPSPRPSAKSIAACLAGLGHPALSVRLENQRVLADRASESEGALVALVTQPGHRAARLHALWALDSIGTTLARRTIREALTDTDSEIRAQAARSTGIRRDRNTTGALARRLGDSSPIVRREAAIALGRIGDPVAVPSLMAALGDDDPFVDWSVRQSIRAIGAWDKDELGAALRDPDRRDSALKLCDGSWSVPVVSALVEAQSGPSEPDWQARLVETLAGLYRRYPERTTSWYGPNPLAGEFPRKTSEWDPAGMAVVLDGLSTAFRSRHAKVRRQAAVGLFGAGQRALPTLRPGLERESDAANLEVLARTLGALHDGEAVTALSRLFADPGRPIAVRQAALEALEALNVPQAFDAPARLVQDATSPVSLVASAIEALGRQAPAPALDLSGFLSHSATPIRLAALHALARALDPPSKVRRAVAACLDDPAPEVRCAAIKTAAALKLHETVPKLREIAADPAYQHDATLALAKLPDESALSVYLDALADINPEVRSAGRSALMAIRERVALELVTQAEAGRFSGDTALAVERVLARFSPLTDWKVIGPFPRNTPQVFDDPMSIDFSRRFMGAGERFVGWSTRRAEPATGRIALDDFRCDARGLDRFGYDSTGSPDLAAFAWTEVAIDRDRPALLLVGSSGTISITINGKTTFHSDNSSGRAYAPDSDVVRVELKRGKNEILVKTRQGIGTWSFSLQLSGRLQIDAASPTGPAKLAGLCAFGLAHGGDPERGEALFFDARGIGCGRCHSAGGRGNAMIGPDLTGLALKYDKAEIIRSVLDPSSRIVNGYQPVVLCKTDGTVLTGLLRGETETYLDLVDPNLQPIQIQKSDIDERRLGEISLMPAGLVELLTPAEFADLIAYLQSLGPTPRHEPAQER